MTHARNRPYLSIILPTYNEAQNIVDLIRELKRTVKVPNEIIVVDDNSPDGTSKLVNDYIRQYKRQRVRIEIRLKDKGLTNSISRGIQLARGQIVAWMDCDFSMPPRVINTLMAKLEEGYDIAAGSRFIPGGQTKRLIAHKKDSVVAILFSSLLNLCIRLLLGSWFHDYTSGFVVVRKQVFDALTLRGNYGEYFIDFIYRAHSASFRIAEVPYVCLPRRKGESKTSGSIWKLLRLGIQYLTMTIRVRLGIS